MCTYQYYRDNLSELAKYKHKDMIPLLCSKCNITYYREKRNVRTPILYQKAKEHYCSKLCQSAAQVTSVTEPCGNCLQPVTRNLSSKKSVKHIFCNSSCAASYNNKNKQYGTRRSKLEAYLESELRTRYPVLEVVANGKKAIGSELDFYFPQLRFAIELNGPTHYEPIYGNDKFERIQQNDKQKMIRCYEAGIELLVIDVSKVSHVNESKKAYFLDIVLSHIDLLMGRMVTPVVIETTSGE